MSDTSDRDREFREAALPGEGWEELPDLTALAEDELRARLAELAEEERRVSYRRRVLQGRIDLIRAELVRRGGVTLSPEELARVLMGESLEEGPEDREAEDREGEDSGSGTGGAPGGGP